MMGFFYKAYTPTRPAADPEYTFILSPIGYVYFILEFIITSVYTKINLNF